MLKINILVYLFLIYLNIYLIYAHQIICKKYYTTVEGDDCYKIAIENKMSKDQLQIINPGIY